jgi:hypothetical protein
MDVRKEPGTGCSFAVASWKPPVGGAESLLAEKHSVLPSNVSEMVYCIVRDSSTSSVSHEFRVDVSLLYRHRDGGDSELAGISDFIETALPHGHRIKASISLTPEMPFAP